MEVNFAMNWVVSESRSTSLIGYFNNFLLEPGAMGQGQRCNW